MSKTKNILEVGYEKVESPTELLDIFGGDIGETLTLEHANIILAKYDKVTDQITLQTAQQFQSECSH